eukprot:Rmarinus@m.26200
MMSLSSKFLRVARVALLNTNTNSSIATTRGARTAFRAIGTQPTSLKAAYTNGHRDSTLVTKEDIVLQFSEWNSCELNANVDHQRQTDLAAQTTDILVSTIESFKNPIMTTAMQAGGMVLLDLLHKTGHLQKVPVIFVDTMHVFPETIEYIKSVEAHYNFKVSVFTPEGVSNRKEFDDVYGSDVAVEDSDTYDYVAKVEPLHRSISSSEADAWINGRRKDQGESRRQVRVFEREVKVGDRHLCKVQPLCHWSFEDVFKYLLRCNVPIHPLHLNGYPSIGDVHSTQRVPLEKWFAPGGERSGRFQGMKNKDGSVKRECGIHL